MTLFPTLISRSIRTAPAALALGLALVSATPLLAQQGGITVTVTGQAEVKPDVLVFEGTLMESAESAGDAVVAFRDTRRRALKAIEMLDIEGLSVTATRLRLSQGGEAGGGMGGMMVVGPGMGGGEAEAAPGELAISQTVTIQVTGIDQLEQEELIDLIIEINDATNEAGISIGEMTQEEMMMMQFGQGAPSTDLALFRVSDPEQARADAAQEAMEKARTQAQRLATLAGVELGKVTAIVEGMAATDSGEQGGYMMSMIFGMANGDDNTDALSSTALEPISVVTTLTVTFAID